VQPDGKALVAGQFTSSSTTDIAVARLTATLDTTFGGVGYKLGTGPLNYEFGANGVALQSDGSIIVAGVASDISTGANVDHPLLMRFYGDNAPPPAPASSTITSVDDEPRISISDVTKAEGKKGQTTLFTFTVTLSAAYDQAVTMSYRTVDGTAKTSDSDYVAKTGTLTFNPGETTKTITIEVKGDNKKEANETFYLDLFDSSSNSLLAKNRGIGTILNDD
ncbi:MAG TPA: Calx-beta domain-containing protein, partial [Pirellulaceae bacterium]|nr:Calx-beta domain-containing protein [Pirellulaceae bacterium]